jgi:hypothetical protein
LDKLPTDLSTWKPPMDVGPVFRRNGESCSKTFQKILDVLDGGSPALLLMTLSHSFYAPDESGIVIAPVGELPDPTRRHAMVAVAHGSTATGRVVMVRNSWGQGWGSNGHAWLTEMFVTPRIIRVAVLLEEINVHPNHVAA